MSLAAFMHCVTFTAWALNWLTAVKAPSGDYLVLHRTLLWTASTCALIAVLTSMVPPSGARRAVLGPTVGADVCMMLFGAAEHALPNPARALFLTLACGLFVVTVRGQMVLLRMAAEELDDEEDVAPLLLMRRTLVATWSTYPLLRLAFHAGVVSANSQARAGVGGAC